jgi:hypothetical protein
VLTPTAANAIAAALPFGIYSFGAMLPNGSGAVTFAPVGFVVHFDPLDSVTNMRKINFAINLKNPSGLIFDANAPLIAGIFTSPQFGPVDFFISTPDGFTPDQLPQVRNDPGIDIVTQMAWAELNSGVQTIQTKFNGRKLHPRAEIIAIDQPPPPPPA